MAQKILGKKSLAFAHHPWSSLSICSRSSVLLLPLFFVLCPPLDSADHPLSSLASTHHPLSSFSLYSPSSVLLWPLITILCPPLASAHHPLSSLASAHHPLSSSGLRSPRAGNSLICSSLIRSFCSNQMSDRERYAQIAQDIHISTRERIAQVAQRK